MRSKLVRCLLAGLVLVFFLPGTPALAASKAAVPAVAPAAVPAAAPAVAPAAAPRIVKADGIWGTIACSVILAPVFGGMSSGACVAGKILAPAASDAISSALQSTIVKPMADGMGEFTAQVLKVGLTWWLTTSSVSVESSGVTSQQTGTGPDGSPVTFSLQGICLGVGEMIAILLVMFAGIRAMIQRKGKPIADALQGLVINVLVCVLGITIIDSLLVASDSLTNGIIDVAFHGDAKLSERMVAMLLPTGFNPMALLVMALLVLLIGVVQFALLFLRQASIPIQALLLPIAGSGQVGGERTRQWLPKLYTSIFTVIAYKPMAALIISAGFVELANGNSIVDWLRGIVTLALSVIALKSLMGLFAPLGASVAGATAGGFAGALAGAGGLAELGGRMRGGKGGGDDAQPTTAVKHAAAMAKQSGGNPKAAAIQAGVGAVNAAKNTAGNSMGQPGKEGGNVPKQSQGAPQASQGKNGQDGQGGGQGPATPSTGGPGAPRGGGGNSGGVSMSLRAAEAGARGVQGAGNTVSEGSNGQ